MYRTWVASWRVLAYVAVDSSVGQSVEWCCSQHEGVARETENINHGIIVVFSDGSQKRYNAMDKARYKITISPNCQCN